MPLGGHVPCLLQHIDLIEDLISHRLVRTQEVIVGDPERDVIVRAIVVVISALYAVGLLECAIQPFDELFKGTELPGHLIIICQANDLRDMELKVVSVFVKELLGSKNIGTVAI